MTDIDRLVGDAKSLSVLVDAISNEPLIALDTEFVREQTYYPRLCLIQVATPRTLACVDCVAGMDLQPLFSALLAPGRTWLLHSVRQDLEAMQQFMVRPPARLIDTQIAAALLGKTPQVGLQAILEEELNIRLDKDFTRTNWAARPLPAGALLYALDDVRHLSALWEALRPQLSDLGRLAWLEEDCLTALETPVLTPPAALWSRLKGMRATDSGTRCAALALVEWRERCAQRLDRPRRWLCSDELLVRVAKALPNRVDDLTSIPGTSKAHGAAVRQRDGSRGRRVREREKPAIGEQDAEPNPGWRTQAVTRRSQAARRETEYRSAGSGNPPGTQWTTQRSAVRQDRRRLAME